MNSISRLFAITAIFPGFFSVAAAEGLRVVEHPSPVTIEAGSRASISIVVANDCSHSWSSADGFAISYHWLDTAGETVVWDGLRSPLPDIVHPGASIELVAFVEAPRMPGDYLLRWDVVQEGVQWLSETGATEPDPIPVSVFAGRAFTVLKGIAPRVMTAGSVSVVELVLHNDGSRTWTTDGSMAAAYHWLGREGGGVRPNGQGVYWEGRRTLFPTAVRSGDTVALDVAVVAPDRPGLWRLQWDLVEEGVCWFSDCAPEQLPAFRVLVIPDPWASGIWWSLLVLCAGAAAVSTWRSGGPPALVVLFSIGDVVWCVSALSVKQAIVLAESGAGPTATGWMLIVAGASVLVLVTRVLPGRFRGWACWGLVAGATLLLWADSIYLRFFGDLPAAAAIAGVGQLGQIESSIRELLAAGDAWLWLDLLPGVVLVLIADRLRRDSGSRQARGVVVGLLAMIVGGGLAAAYLVLTPPNLLAQVFRRVNVAEEVGVLNLHAVDCVRAVARGVVRRELEPAKFDEVVAWFRERAPQRAGAGSSFAAAKDANLVMVQVESLQAFVVGLEDWRPRGDAVPQPLGGRCAVVFKRHRSDGPGPVLGQRARDPGFAAADGRRGRGLPICGQRLHGYGRGTWRTRLPHPFGSALTRAHFGTVARLIPPMATNKASLSRTLRGARTSAGVSRIVTFWSRRRAGWQPAHNLSRPTF